MKSDLLFLFVISGLFVIAAVSASPLSEEQKELLKEQHETYKSQAEDEAQYYEETAPPDINADPDYLMRDHPLQEEPLQENPIP